ncbi:type II toxin-antitoxin system VapC family toxin [Alkanindiges illinoisensis]|uniref:Type II toxin-antitoxin system VapC family toxin n=1 Tax=Alkanindiges illinoisensis TaxID=197183 RepID=A0A4Y7XF08_9GAMM|nr:type II toxin-antitoxin system VapC family toxin [Alkanindiges illinoisensis]TEU30345.1 type II toxin-antitoxin system VapC family toxin [Alkanindiges illinoisensis]
MIAIDTNIIIRLLTHDDSKQYDIAYKLFQDSVIYIADSVILESEWVLRYAYDFSAAQICNAMTKLFGLPNIILDNPALIAQVINWYSQGLDFGDAMHLAKCEQVSQLKTFDQKFIKKAVGLSLCQVTLAG